MLNQIKIPVFSSKPVDLKPCENEQFKSTESIIEFKSLLRELETLYRLEEVKVVGIPFINSDWKMETVCPKCREKIEFQGRIDKETKKINTKIKFCNHCGHEINWDIRHLL
jgi:hypothetical protein